MLGSVCLHMHRKIKEKHGCGCGHLAFHPGNCTAVHLCRPQKSTMLVTEGGRVLLAVHAGIAALINPRSHIRYRRKKGKQKERGEHGQKFLLWQLHA